MSRREDIEDLIQLDQYIDLIVPRGSSELVKSIQERSKGIPVLGHSEGICHVFVDCNANPEMALKIGLLASLRPCYCLNYWLNMENALFHAVKDSKCDYPAACNAMETLLLHKSLLNTPLFDEMIEMMKANKVSMKCSNYVISRPWGTLYTQFGLTVNVKNGIFYFVLNSEFGST